MTQRLALDCAGYRSTKVETTMSGEVGTRRNAWECWHLEYQEIGAQVRPPYCLFDNVDVPRQTLMVMQHEWIGGIRGMTSQKGYVYPFTYLILMFLTLCRFQIEGVWCTWNPCQRIHVNWFRWITDYTIRHNTGCGLCIGSIGSIAISSLVEIWTSDV